MKRICMLLLACLFFCLPSAHGQLGLYAGFSAADTNLPNESWLYGGTAGAYYNTLKLPVVNLGIDARAAFVNGSGNPEQRIVSGLVGPRLELHLPVVPLKPFVAGYIGGSHVKAGEGIARVDKTVLSYGYAAGADLTVFPRVDWRVVEYAWVRSNAYGGLNQSTLTTGLVLRLPVP